MGKFIKKSPPVEAFQYGVDDSPEWFNEAMRNGLISLEEQSGQTHVMTMGGEFPIEVRDYIVLESNGELAPWPEIVFDMFFIKTND
jgi:hypothetical protein